MDELHTDIESKSRLNLTKVGLDRFARHSSTEIIMGGWAVNKEPVDQWRIDLKWRERLRKQQVLIDHLRNKDLKKIAHNSQFERTMFAECWLVDTPIEEWECTQTWMYLTGLPGGLDEGGEVVKLPLAMRKFKEGRKLIKIFCMPNKLTKKRTSEWRDWNTDPEKWAEFCAYNRQDIEAERFLAHRRLNKYPVSEEDWKMFFINQRENEHGWPIDREFVSNAVEIVDEEMASIKSQMIEITGLENPNSDKQFGPWARKRGYPFGDMRAATVRQALELDGWLYHNKYKKEVLAAFSLRSELKKTSVKKAHKILLQMSDIDDRLRYTYQFSGAKRTGRTAGRGAQMQNPKRPSKMVKEFRDDIVQSIREKDGEWLRAMYGSPMAVISESIRAAARAEPGKQFVIADLHAIEACVSAWLANCTSMLDVFAKNLDIYKSYGVKFLGIPYDEITADQRQLCKPPVLGCCFRLSGGEEKVNKKGDIKKTGLWGYAENMGVSMTKEEAAAAVEVYRDSYPEICQFWYDLERAAKQAVQTGKRVVVSRPPLWRGSPYIVPLSFDIKGPFLRFHLPDGGRPLHYLRPKIERVKAPWGEWKWTLTYEGQEDDGDRIFYGRTPTHGGKLCENGVQAVANRILRVGECNAVDFGFSLCGESHDELITHEDVGSDRYTVENLVKCMVRKKKWMCGMPLKAAGSITPFYWKD